ncbi:hypothetical protein ASG40_20095 [Methylobacterium sp. Leaf399]|uniref:hypothetical protein n=1 Tax=unclassified Methylobacterium TaxID=2615210 RepID=UPI0006FB037D|nr:MULTISPECIES: hypothetical protein [unclassified Methylobacterium]KQP48918.1 hypothetical protein ASF39_14245 [Methylobacterium sp. Leaf108]KQT10550.1 hypothetical protein ASG40_20095 [Methylobacterium sp. Leaf399]
MSLPTPALTRGTFHAALLALLCFSEQAQSEPRLEGRFQGRGEGLLTLRVADVSTEPNRPEYYVTTDTAVPNECTGSVGGLATLINPGTLRLRQKGEGSEQTCEVTLRFSPDRSRVTMSAQNCSDYHGMSCDFAGALKRR